MMDERAGLSAVKIHLHAYVALFHPHVSHSNLAPPIIYLHSFINFSISATSNLRRDGIPNGIQVIVKF